MKTYNSDHINDLKREIIQGNKKALTLLYKEYFSKLKYYGIQLIQSKTPISIDDVIQDLFLWIASNPEKLKDVSNLEVYLFVSLKTNLYNKLHLQKSRVAIKDRYDLSQNLRNQSSESSVEQQYIDIESKQLANSAVNTLLDQLPPAQKQVLYLRNYANLNYKEIAQIMDLSEQVARNYAYRALINLQKKANNNSNLRSELGGIS